MSFRLVINNVVQPDMARMPRVAELGFSCASIIGDGGVDDPGWCISLVMGPDLLSLDSEPDVVKVFPIADVGSAEELAALLDQSPDELGWSADQLNDLANLITGRGGAVDDLPLSSAPLHCHLTVLATLLGAGAADAARLWAG